MNIFREIEAILYIDINDIATLWKFTFLEN